MLYYVEGQKKGITLVEIIVSMLLLGIIAAGIYATFSFIGKGAGTTGILDLKGANIARETLEILKNAVSTDVVKDGQGWPLVDNNPSQGQATEYDVKTIDIKLPKDWSGKYYVDDIDVDGDDNTDYKKVTVVIQWPD